MSIRSINEPNAPAHEITLTPQSPNEPATLPEWATEPPTVASIDPAECTLGDPDFRVYLTGTGFYEQSILVFAGHDEPTTLESDGRLSTGVNMAVWHGPDTVKVGVRNGPIASNEVDFTFKAAEEPTGETHKAHPPADTRSDDIDPTDPDELEDELEQAEEEGDFKPTHGPARRKR